MSERIVPQIDVPEQTEQNSRRPELTPAEYYRYLRSQFVPEDEAAHQVDVAFGFVPPPPEPWQ